MENKGSNKAIRCHSCNAELSEGNKFCTECGSPLESSTFDNAPIIEPIKKNTDNDTYESLKETNKNFLNDFKESRTDVVNEIGNIINKVASGYKNNCTRCGAKLPNNANFCTECGSHIEHRKPVQVPERTIIEKKPTHDELEELEYLEKLADLRDKGIISDEEFKKKKKDILKL